MADKFPIYSNFDWAYTNILPQRTNEIIEGLKKHGKTEIHVLDKVKSLLSIGPGNGEVDKGFITDLSPDVRVYYAVDSDEHLLSLTKDKIDNLGSVEGYYVHCCIEDYEGPLEKVDAILMCHSLYNLRMSIESCINKVYQWLNPGGVLIIIIDSNSSTNGQASIFNILNQAKAAALVTSDAMEDAIRRLYLRFSKYKVNSTLHISLKNPDELMKIQEMCILRTPSNKELEQFRHVLAQHCSTSETEEGRSIIHTHQTIFVIKKELDEDTSSSLADTKYQ